MAGHAAGAAEGEPVFSIGMTAVAGHPGVRPGEGEARLFVVEICQSIVGGVKIAAAVVGVAGKAARAAVDLAVEARLAEDRAVAARAQAFLSGRQGLVAQAAFCFEACVRSKALQEDARLRQRAQAAGIETLAPAFPDSKSQAGDDDNSKGNRDRCKERQSSFHKANVFGNNVSRAAPPE